MDAQPRSHRLVCRQGAGRPTGPGPGPDTGWGPAFPLSHPAAWWAHTEQPGWGGHPERPAGKGNCPGPSGSWPRPGPDHRLSTVGLSLAATGVLQAWTPGSLHSLCPAQVCHTSVPPYQQPPHPCLVLRVLASLPSSWGRGQCRGHGTFPSRGHMVRVGGAGGQAGSG